MNETKPWLMIMRIRALVRKLLVDASSSSILWKCETLSEELVQLLFLQLHHQVVECGVEEAGLSLTGDLVLPLAKVCLDIKEISVWAAEYPLC